ncbi:zinc-binding dehydrogenase [Streptomyces sp. NPDC094468]|uniref:zinc-binding dehydrogenase n=1 Tax=Streptomyces sp. NPDC094468 TaxID=3366066 RepID=UPI00382C8053
MVTSVTPDQDTSTRSCYKLVGGRFVTTTVLPGTERGISVVRANAESNSYALAQMLQLATDRLVHTPVASEFKLVDASDAYRELQAGSGSGRVVLTRT